MQEKCFKNQLPAKISSTDVFEIAGEFLVCKTLARCCLGNPVEVRGHLIFESKYASMPYP
jgi:hypothetical protein